jgi:ribonuclease VapC
MIVDASAVVAILYGEPECADFITALESADKPMMSMINHMEVAIKVDRDPDPVQGRTFDRFIREVGIELMPVTGDHLAVARAAYRDFGKGSGHRAGLNLGDCFAYALATVTDNPLLYKGNDFVHTDIRSAI